MAEPNVDKIQNIGKVCSKMTPENSTASTGDLFLMLENEKDILENWQELSRNMNAAPFHEYLCSMASDKNINVSELVVKALLSRSFAYQIFSGDRIPSRDIILRIALVMEISLDETQRLLKLADRGALYPKNERDAVIIYGINNSSGLYKTDEALVRLGQEPLL